MVNVDKLKQLKKKLTTFKKISKKDSVKGKELANEIISLINEILENNKVEDKINKNLNMTRDTLQVYISNLDTMDKLKQKWN